MTTALSHIVSANRVEDLASTRFVTRTQQTQDRRKVLRYKRRWLLGRFFSWLMRWRRLITHYEHKAEDFPGFVQLACTIILRRY